MNGHKKSPLRSNSKANIRINPRKTKRQRIKKYDLVSRWPKMGGKDEK